MRRADPPSKESYRLCIKLKNWKSSEGPTKGMWSHRHVDRWMDGVTDYFPFLLLLLVWFQCRICRLNVCLVAVFLRSEVWLILEMCCTSYIIILSWSRLIITFLSTSLFVSDYLAILISTVSNTIEWIVKELGESRENQSQLILVPSAPQASHRSNE
jgi:hypothetical protein